MVLWTRRRVRGSIPALSHPALRPSSPPCTAAHWAAWRTTAAHSLPIMASMEKGLSTLVFGVSSSGMACLLGLAAGTGAAGCRVGQQVVHLEKGCHSSLHCPIDEQQSLHLEI